MRRSRAWYLHEVAGHNFRLTNLQAALGCAQLEKLSVILSERKRVYETYRRLLAGFEGVTLQGFDREVEPVVWACALRLEPEAFPQGRNELMRRMLEAGVETRPGFYAATAMSHMYQAAEIPESEELSRWVLSLPFFATLTEEEIEYACSVLSSFRR
jgi:perosamine synthetase